MTCHFIVPPHILAAAQAEAAQSSSDSGGCGVPNAAEQSDPGTALLMVPWCNLPHHHYVLVGASGDRIVKESFSIGQVISGTHCYSGDQYTLSKSVLKTYSDSSF